MKQFEQQKITVLEKKLATEIRRLSDEIKKLPAYIRRKKDEERWEDFFTFFALSAFVGIVIFGTGGWLAVALSGSLFTLIFVESGLISSIGIGFSAWPLYNTYLWMRDLFSSEKIKNQNKDYDQCHKNLFELKELATEKNNLKTKITYLKDAIQCLPSLLFDQEKTGVAQLDLNDQIQRLERQKKKLPAHIRKQKDKHIWNQILQYSAMTSCATLGLFTILVMMAGVTTFSLLIGPVFPVLVIMAATMGLLIVAPITLSSVVYATFLGVRNLFSSAEIKNENKECAWLEKAIKVLKKLDEQQSQLDGKINSKLKCVDENLAQTPDHQETEKTSDSLSTNLTQFRSIFSVPTKLGVTVSNAIYSQNFTH